MSSYHIDLFLENKQDDKKDLFCRSLFSVQNSNTDVEFADIVKDIRTKALDFFERNQFMIPERQIDFINSLEADLKSKYEINGIFQSDGPINFSYSDFKNYGNRYYGLSCIYKTKGDRNSTFIIQKIKPNNELIDMYETNCVYEDRFFDDKPDKIYTKYWFTGINYKFDEITDESGISKILNLLEEMDPSKIIEIRPNNYIAKRRRRYIKKSYRRFCF